MNWEYIICVWVTQSVASEYPIDLNSVNAHLAIFGFSVDPDLPSFHAAS